MYPKNAASPEPIAIGAVVQISDGAVQTSGCTVRIKPIGVAEADGGGTTAYSTDGIVLYTPTQAETNYTSFVLIAKKTGCIPVAITVVTSASATAGYAGTDQSKIANPTSTVALTGTTIATTQQVDVNTIKTQAVTCSGGVTIPAATLASTTNITAATGVVLSGVTHTGAVIPTVTDLTNMPSIPANWITTAGIADGAITNAKFAAGAISSTTFAAGAVDGTALGNSAISQSKIATGAFTAAKFSAGAIDAAALAADAVTEIAAAIVSGGAINTVGGAVTTVTNLTNAPTAGDLTATMKASVNTEIDTALADIHLDHLLAVDYDPTAKPGVATALLNELVQSNGSGISQFTVIALAQAPAGGGGGSTDWTADERTAIRTILGVPAVGTTPDVPTAGALKVIDDFLDTEVAAIKAKTDNLPTDPADTSDIAASFATVNSTLSTIAAYVDTEVAAIKVVTDKVGTMVELDGAVYRYTTNALEQAPSGGGGGGSTAADIWAYATRTLTQSAAQVAAAVSGSRVTLLRGDTISFSLTGLGSLASRTKLWITGKWSIDETTDAEAAFQIEETAGLVVINGSSPISGQTGSIIVTDASAGNVTITLSAAASAALDIFTKGRYDIQVTIGGVVTTKTAGELNVTSDVTRATA